MRISPVARAALAAITAIAVAVGFVIFTGRTRGLPSPDSEEYEATTRQFFRGLAALQVGLIDTAKESFTQATTTAPEEPASWANLGLAHLRLGEFDPAAAALDRATDLSPDHAHVAFLRGRLEAARGRRDEGIAALRRAVELDPGNLQARTALIQEVENAAGPNADAEAQQLLEGMVEQQPNNPAVLVERTRLAAKRGDIALVRDSVARLQRFAGAWPPEVVEQFTALQQAAAAGDAAQAARAVAFLRNVLVRVPTFLDARRAVTPSTELIADPFTTFVRLPNPAVTPSPADDALSFAAETLGDPASNALSALVAFSLDGDAAPVVFGADARELRRIDIAGAALALSAGSATAGGRAGAATTPAAPPDDLLALDWNHDFRMDLVVTGAFGVRLFVQGADGTFTDDTLRASERSGPILIDVAGSWAADIEMDGDLDIVLGPRVAAPTVLRNNGDGTWEATLPFGPIAGVRSFAWADIDGDGDPDAALVDAAGTLHILDNLQAGQFERITGPPGQALLRALAVGDLNADGAFEIVTLDAAGVIRRVSPRAGGWVQQTLVTWRPVGESSARVFVADFDNNGALDVLASDGTASAVWLALDDRTLRPLGRLVEASIVDVLDLTGDGQLDLVGLAAGRPVRLTGKGTRGYHHHVVRPRAQTAVGDQRINSFGIGGEVEVRAGRLVQKQPIAGPAVHLGLGTHTAIDVTRIVWPNGVPQAEFDPTVDRPIVAEQRLKGSCPWVFADNGTGMQFVTDFLWRSPLGLRINAQDTAGVSQTEDWIRIRGDQLAARAGAYDIRITAELWETHYIDHVSLMVVDHPAGTEVFVDERFARQAPALAVRAMTAPVPVAKARDHRGEDVTALVAAQDGRYLATFQRGPYQGVAEEHFVEFELGSGAPRNGRRWLVAHGWIYPTDSSINVAIGQGGRIQPRGLSLEAQASTGQWVVIEPDLGFPAGKSKTILIDLEALARAGVPGATRLRLRTNLEIYWDAIGSAAALDDSSLRTTRIAASAADLRSRGFSVTRQERRDLPETPVYGRLANTSQRWRDLVGYYTRYGDVRELVAATEDRYVILNAGDELRLSFPALAAPADGWRRDFVLIGDGWNKDGDFNTSYSKTVLPLPSHGATSYEAASFSPVLEDDPVYRRFRDDWLTYHTRYVVPDTFLGGLHR